MSKALETFTKDQFVDLFSQTDDQHQIYQNLRIPSLRLFDNSVENTLSSGQYAQLSFRDLTYYVLYFEEELKSAPKHAHAVANKLSEHLIAEKSANAKFSEFVQMIFTVYDYCKNFFSLFEFTSTETLAENLCQSLFSVECPPDPPKHPSPIKLTLESPAGTPSFPKTMTTKTLNPVTEPITDARKKLNYDDKGTSYTPPPSPVSTFSTGPGSVPKGKEQTKVKNPREEALAAYISAFKDPNATCPKQAKTLIFLNLQQAEFTPTCTDKFATFATMIERLCGSPDVQENLKQPLTHQFLADAYIHCKGDGKDALTEWLERQPLLPKELLLWLFKNFCSMQEGEEIISLKASHVEKLLKYYYTHFPTDVNNLFAARAMCLLFKLPFNESEVQKLVRDLIEGPKNAASRTTASRIEALNQASSLLPPSQWRTSPKKTDLEQLDAQVLRMWIIAWKTKDDANPGKKIAFPIRDTLIKEFWERFCPEGQLPENIDPTLSNYIQTKFKEIR